MILVTFKNGSLTREWVRDQSANKDWIQFNKHLDEVRHRGRRGEDEEKKRGRRGGSEAEEAREAY
jgi:hypothetical protein